MRLCKRLGHMVLIILTLAGIRVGVGVIGRTPLPIRSASTARLALRDHIEMVEVKPGVWIAEGTEAEYLAQKAVTTPAGSRTPPLRSDTTPPLSEATRQPPMKTASAVAEEGEATKIATTAEAGKLEEASSSRGAASEFSDVPESTWPHEFWPDDMESLPTPSSVSQVDAANIRGTKPEFLLISRFGKPALKWSLYRRSLACQVLRDIHPNRRRQDESRGRSRAVAPYHTGAAALWQACDRQAERIPLDGGCPVSGNTRIPGDFRPYARKPEWRSCRG